MAIVDIAVDIVVVPLIFIDDVVDDSIFVVGVDALTMVEDVDEEVNDDDDLTMTTLTITTMK